MKKVLYLCILFLLFSCEVQYDGATRLIIKTTIIDENGNPIKDILIDVDAENDNMSDNISYTYTDENGFSFQVFPPLKRQGTFNIHINPDRKTYQSKMIRNIKESDFQDLIFDLGTVTLIKNENIVDFKVQLNRINENNSIENIKINAIVPEEFIDYHGILEENYYPETYFRVLKNQNFTVFYSIRDYSTNPATLTNHSIDVAVENESVTYQLEY